MLTYIVAFLSSLVVAAVTTPLVAQWAVKNGWFDLPGDARKVHTRATPRLGGIAVVTAFFAPLAGLAIYTNRISNLLYADAQAVVALCLGAVAIVGLGIWDDLRGADAKLKLTVQTLVAVGMWLAGFRIELLGNPLGDPVQLGMLSLPITALWIVGVVNALNLIDGLDGLAAGISMFVVLVLFAVAFVDNAVLLCLLAAALGGSLVGFLFFNFNPARIFLGDSGSMFLGFVLASISIWTQRKGATAVALLIPVLALGVPILDTTLSFVRRVARRQNPFKADREHLHHRLMALGLSHRNAVFTLYTVSAIFALGALALLDNDTTRRAIVLSTVATVTVLLVRKIGGLKGPKVSLDRAPPVTLRDDARRTARAIREAVSEDVAWRELVAFLATEPRFLEVRLGWTQSDARGPERRESVFCWRRPDHERWALDGTAPMPADAIRLKLEEANDHFGELAFLPAFGDETSPEDLLAAEMIRDALIDFSVIRDAESVVRLPTTPGLASNLRTL